MIILHYNWKCKQSISYGSGLWLHLDDLKRLSVTADVVQSGYLLVQLLVWIQGRSCNCVEFSFNDRCANEGLLSLSLPLSITQTLPWQTLLCSDTFIYRPPGHIWSFIEELDTTLSLFPVDGTPNHLLGDLNLQMTNKQQKR